ncbi:hypothetical protein, conserved [Babesia bigemina]|uniref:Uncharacterized protein n=1 Tax=Babesia bigemina TaxID=5866 RepID=A0A061DB88_BABBI|nr:hypothetical protein, conserved [Babesia bigemina]CDR95005.1 hypothetical protein, conserved [Babesia bigemina]|eukprot:XP_012767191.1 hypothetical protein, conserved [Babesia bigemina]
MEANERVKQCLERLEALRMEVPRIARVLSSADDVLERRHGADANWAPSPASPMAQIRVAMLDRNVERLRKAHRQFKPVVDGATAMLERIENVASRIAAAKRNMQGIEQSGVYSEMDSVRQHIALTEKRLGAVNRVVEQLNPSIGNIDIGGVVGEDQADNAGAASMERVLEAAQGITESKNFCDALHELEYLKGSPVLHEASQRINANVDRLCETCFLGLQKASRKMSLDLCAACDDASTIALRHSNSFVPPPAGHEIDEIGFQRIFECSDEAGASLALRALRLLRLRPTYLYHFVSGMREILGQLSTKRFSAYANAVSVEPNNRSASVSVVLEHLVKNVEFMKRCVEGIYGNAGLPLSESGLKENGVEFIGAPNYLREILRRLVNPLETKLNRIMEPGSVKGDESIVTCDSVLDIFNAIHISKMCVKRMKEVLTTPWDAASAPAGIVIGDPPAEIEVDNKGDGEANTERGNYEGVDVANDVVNKDADNEKEKKSADKKKKRKNRRRYGIRRNYYRDYSDDDYDSYSDYSRRSYMDDDDYYYDEHSSYDDDSESGSDGNPDTKPYDPYRYPYRNVPQNTKGGQAGEENDYVAHDPLISTLRRTQSDWRNYLIRSINDRITAPLEATEAFFMDAAAILDMAVPQSVRIVADFIADLTNIQVLYDVSDDFEEVLRQTVVPAVNWCRRSAERCGDTSSAYIINCTSVLLDSMTSELVPAFYKEPLQADLNKKVDSMVSTLAAELETSLELKDAELDSDKAASAMNRISGIVFGDRLMDCDIPSMKQLRLVTNRYQKVIKSRLYATLADHYAKISKDGDSQKVQEIREVATHL